MAAHKCFLLIQYGGSDYEVVSLINANVSAPDAIQV
jgi:hypothetical protein